MKPSAPKVTKVAPNGISLEVEGHEYFLPFEDHPWFENADATAVRAVTRPGPNHLRWPELDVDLALDSLADPVQTDAAAAPPAPAASKAAGPKRAVAKVKKPTAKPASKPKKPAAKPKKPSRR